MFDTIRVALLAKKAFKQRLTAHQLSEFNEYQALNDALNKQLSKRQTPLEVTSTILRTMLDQNVIVAENLSDFGRELLA